MHQPLAYSFTDLDYVVISLFLVGVFFWLARDRARGKHNTERVRKAQRLLVAVDERDRHESQ